MRELTPGFICKILFLGSTSGTGSCQGSISKPVLGDDRFELIQLQEELGKWRSVRGVEGSEKSPTSLSSQAQLGNCNYEGVICKDVYEMLLPLFSFFLCRTTARYRVVDLFPDGHQDLQLGIRNGHGTQESKGNLEPATASVTVSDCKKNFRWMDAASILPSKSHAIFSFSHF